MKIKSVIRQKNFLYPAAAVVVGSAVLAGCQQHHVDNHRDFQKLPGKISPRCVWPLEQIKQKPKPGVPGSFINQQD